MQVMRSHYGNVLWPSATQKSKDFDHFCLPASENSSDCSCIFSDHMTWNSCLLAGWLPMAIYRPIVLCATFPKNSLLLFNPRPVMCKLGIWRHIRQSGLRELMTLNSRVMPCFLTLPLTLDFQFSKTKVNPNKRTPTLSTLCLLAEGNSHGRFSMKFLWSHLRLYPGSVTPWEVAVATRAVAKNMGGQAISLLSVFITLPWWRPWPHRSKVYTLQLVAHPKL